LEGLLSETTSRESEMKGYLKLAGELFNKHLGRRYTAKQIEEMLDSIKSSYMLVTDNLEDDTMKAIYTGIQLGMSVDDMLTRLEERKMASVKDLEKMKYLSEFVNGKPGLFAMLELRENIEKSLQIYMQEKIKLDRLSDPSGEQESMMHWAHPLVQLRVEEQRRLLREETEARLRQRKKVIKQLFIDGERANLSVDKITRNMPDSFRPVISEISDVPLDLLPAGKSLPLVAAALFDGREDNVLGLLPPSMRAQLQGRTNLNAGLQENYFRSSPVALFSQSPQSAAQYAVGGVIPGQGLPRAATLAVMKRGLNMLQKGFKLFS